MLVLAGLLGRLLAESAAAESPEKPETVVAHVGGGQVAAEQFHAYAETMTTLAFPKYRFRNFGWEGDTVYEQPREYGYPSLVERLKQEKPDTIFLEFGRTECLDGARSVGEFKEAYGKLLTSLAPMGAKLRLVTPVPFDRGPAMRPNLALRNVELAKFATAVRDLGRERGMEVVDLFLALGGISPTEKLTSDGLQFTAAGYARIAQARTGESSAEIKFKGTQALFRDKEIEKLRQLIVEKNRLWFHYYRPQNWAFLGGDRVTQPSSRDHRDPKVRWFPKEMEEFLKLIAQKEQEIEEQSLKAMR